MIYPKRMLVAALALAILPLVAQTPATPARIIQAIDNTQVVQLQGNVHPLARAQYDQGPAPADLALNRMLLLLKRSPQQELALQQLLVEQQQPGSSQYHHWLTPQQFGQQFGPAPTDIQTVSAWLASQGFTVTRVAPGGNVIEFNGTAGAVADGFHTSIHRYAVNGASYWANATNPSIPAALAPVVAGVVSLNNFPRATGHVVSQSTGQISTPGHPSPSLTYTDQGATYHAMVPGDFATIYNVTPLYNNNINGSGISIAIVGQTDVNPQDISEFRNLFVPSNPTNVPKVILDGPDPGDIGGDDEVESDLDLEWSGAIAPNATIDFVVSSSTDIDAGIDLSAEYVVDNNLAPVMSTSYSACEPDLGEDGEEFYGELYEQAAAQGITVIDVTGDSGAANCDFNGEGGTGATQGLAISGMASTPYDTAVGGTEFNEGSGTYWNSTNNATNYASVTGPIPETAWNESCADGKNDCDSSAPLESSGGGASIYWVTNGPFGVGKPSWQSTAVTGVQNDGTRDIPDVSFTAAGHDGYVICTAGYCATNSQGEFGFAVVGGTSASAPSFAGVMALVNQKMGTGGTGGQGVANYTLYNLARQENWSACNTANAAVASSASCVFLDTTVGNNSVPCVSGSPNCTNGTLTGYSAGVGYDEVTGLGSMNVANLVNAWSGGTAAQASQTTLSLTPTTFVHGSDVTVDATVTQTSGAPGPTGDVALIGEIPGTTNSLGVDFGTLSNSCGGAILCVSGTENGFPGGTYPVVGRYGGDGNYAPSVSTPVTVTVTPEPSVAWVSVYAFNSEGEGVSVCAPVSSECSVSSITYGTYLDVDGYAEGATAYENSAACEEEGECINDGVPTGTMTFYNNSQLFAPPGVSSSTLALNTDFEAEFPNGVTTIAPGTYTLAASYSGDPSFQSVAYSADLSTDAFTVVQAPASTSVTTAASGTSTVLTATVSTTSLGLPPTGTVTFYSGSTSLGTGTLGAGGYSSTTGYATNTATLTVSSSAITGSVTGEYSGDTNYTGSAAFNIVATTATATVAAGATATYNLSLTGGGGFSGTVALACTGAPTEATCTVSPTSVTLSGSTPASVTVSVATTADSLVPPATIPSQPLGPWAWMLASLLLLFGTGMALLQARLRHRWLARLAVPAFILGMGLALAGCGGGGSSSSSSTPTGTPVGSYLLTVTGTSGSSVSSQTLTLTVN